MSIVSGKKKRKGSKDKDAAKGVIRFGVSLPEPLLQQFDRHIKQKDYSNRSEAIRDLIRQELVQEDWTRGREVAGTITLVYDHHTRELNAKLIRIQHNFQPTILSSQHIHLDHDNCLEVIIMRGRPAEVQRLANKLKATRGVKHCQLTMATTGSQLK